MTLVEFSILYCSIGSAFGAHRYYFQMGGKLKRLLAVLSAVTFWPALVIHVFIKKTCPAYLPIVFEKIRLPDSIGASKIIKHRELELTLTQGFSGDDLYRFRYTIERYKALTLADNASEATSDRTLLEFAPGPSNDVQRICLARRNRNILRRHRTNARMDFVESAVRCIQRAAKPQKTRAAAIRLAKLLNDPEAVSMLREHAEISSQTYQSISVTNMESGTWKPQERQPNHGGI